jgi:hypothetical protein
MDFQLRMYRVKPGEMEEWLAEFEAGVLPLRRRHGFSILGPWVVRDEDRFVWIVGHEDFERADKAYYDSPERAALDPPPTRHLAEIATWMLEPASPTAMP